MTCPHILVLGCAICLLFSGVKAEAQQLLINEGYEENLDLRVQLRGSNQPYEQHALELTAERAHTGTHSLKADFTYRHGITVYLTPRSNETPQVEWGQIGGAGGFNLPGLDIPLHPDRGYLLTLYLWVERASSHNPVQLSVETVSASDYGLVRTETRLEPTFAAPTDGWVKVEQELTSWLMDQMDAAGANTVGLKLNAVLLNSFSTVHERMTVYVDDVTLQEVPLSVVEEHRARQTESEGEPLVFRSYPKVEDFFLWGVYDGLASPGPGWIRPLDRSPGADPRLQQIQMVHEFADWGLLNLRRHYCNTLIQGGGMLFPTEGQSAFEYVQTGLDKCAQYGMMFSPSTYLTQHYIASATREECEAAMRKAAEMWRDHPALLAYWLVDEPGASTADDFYWGKQFIESHDPNNPALCTCNSISSIRTFAPVLPIVCTDYYPIGPVPQQDKGAWAVGDSVRYARNLGAHRIWVLPQVFGQSSWRAPSREEFLIQIFSSLAEGATGFAPYAYADRPQWHNPRHEYGRLVDPYGNASAAWDEMKRLGPLLRSAGALLAGAKRLPETAATAQVRAEIASNVGRRRPACVARVFTDEKRDVRYVVVYNNTTAYRFSFPVAVQEIAEGERVMDLFSMREVPLSGRTFHVFLKPGDGRIFAVGHQAALEAVNKEVYVERYAIERDLVELEITVARRMGTDTGPVEAALGTANSLADEQHYATALEQLAMAMFLLEQQARANEPFRLVNDAVEHSRTALGRTNELMTRGFTGGTGEALRETPEGNELIESMVRLSERFYILQGRLLREGPAGLNDDAGSLLRDIRLHEQTARTLLGG